MTAILKFVTSRVENFKSFYLTMGIFTRIYKYCNFSKYKCGSTRVPVHRLIRRSKDFIYSLISQCPIAYCLIWLIEAYCFIQMFFFWSLKLMMHFMKYWCFNTKISWSKISTGLSAEGVPINIVFLYIFLIKSHFLSSWPVVWNYDQLIIFLLYILCQ